jgi:hypothetical protein
LPAGDTVPHRPPLVGQPPPRPAGHVLAALLGSGKDRAQALAADGRRLLEGSGSGQGSRLRAPAGQQPLQCLLPAPDDDSLAQQEGVVENKIAELLEDGAVVGGRVRALVDLEPVR